MPITLEPLSSGFGVRVAGVTLADELSDGELQTLVDAIHSNLLVLFPGSGQLITDEDLLRFARRLGEINVYFRGAKGMPGERKGEVRLLSNADEFGAVGGSDEIDWHTNVSYQERCAAYTLLNAVELPALGARPRTYWANLRQAFADLPLAVASEIENYQVHYSQKGYQGRVAFRSSDKVPEAVNALVRTHPITGERALYEIGKRVTVKIVGLKQEESDRLMKELLQRATIDEYVYAHDWQLGDTVVWDNLATLHRREPWSSTERRVMRVIDVLEAAPSGSQPEHPLGQILPQDWVGEVSPEAV